MILFEDVSYAYDATPALENVDLYIEDGEYIGIIGPNGGGKTTLLKLILGFLKPTTGSITNSNPSIGYVPQRRHYDRLFPISVLEVVSLGMLQTRHWKKPCLDALEQMGLSHLANTPFSHCSGGQMQRVLIARALVSNPKLLLLDEPTANLDAESTDDILSLLRELKITILMVSHDLQTIINDVDRILCVQGRVSSSLPKDICEHFAMGLYHKPLIEDKQP